MLHAHKVLITAKQQKQQKQQTMQLQQQAISLSNFNASARILLPLMLVLLLLLLMSVAITTITTTVSSSSDNFDAVADALTAVHTGHDNRNRDSNNYVDMPSQQQQHDDNSSNVTHTIDNHNNTILRRGKRYLEFTKGSRMSWRTNGKNNILRINTLFSYGYGFRANYPFPDPKEQRKTNRLFLFKRDLFHGLRTALDGHGFDGRACLLKSFCTGLLDVDRGQKSGMLFKLLKLIFSLEEHEKQHLPYLREENCQQILHSHCPLSFDSISPYTDDV